MIANICLRYVFLASSNLPLASHFQIKYRKDWNDTKSKYTLTETPLLHTVQEAARILDPVWLLPRCLGLDVGTEDNMCTQLQLLETCAHDLSLHADLSV